MMNWYPYIPPEIVFWAWFGGVFAAGWVSCWLVSRLNRDDRKVFLHAILIALFVVVSAAAMAADDKPSAWFCMKARLHRAQFTTDRAAEEAARAQGATNETIARAKLCRR